LPAASVQSRAQQAHEPFSLGSRLNTDVKPYW
jgi:hypothetical protein